MEPTGTALVTGASRGIGRAVALELCHRGFDVVASMRNPAAGRDLAETAGAARAAGSIEVARLDVTDQGGFEIPVGLRVLVNNAGVELENLPVEATPVSAWREMFETNLFGLVEVTRQAIPSLRAAGGGVIANLTTGGLLVPMPFFGVYRASKAAVSALTETHRAELAPFAIRLVEIMPGPVDTDMLAASHELPEAARYPDYAALAQRVGAVRGDSVGTTATPAADAARAIADAIVDDDGPMRYSCDEMGTALLDAWRRSTDEENMAGFLSAFDVS
jgi:NAD(P)-dependent dehydrogenase (short-subunit alcohol dehydrogenase family)